MLKSKDWWIEFYAQFRPAFSKIHPQTTAAEVRYILQTLKLKPGARFLDCPCGIGRISLPLARRGIRVTGVDLTQAYLDELRIKALRRHLPVRTVRADMRRIRFDSEFDAAANWWTSFGYFEREADNLLVLRRAFEALRPGGRFLMQVINRDWVITHFTPSEWYDFKTARALEQRVFNYQTSAMHSVWQFERQAHVTTINVRVRMYSFHELSGMFARVGFSNIRGDGSLRGAPLNADARMMYIVGTKPK